MVDPMIPWTLAQPAGLWQGEADMMRRRTGPRLMVEEYPQKETRCAAVRGVDEGGEGDGEDLGRMAKPETHVGPVQKRDPRRKRSAMDCQHRPHQGALADALLRCLQADSRSVESPDW